MEGSKEDGFKFNYVLRNPKSNTICVRLKISFKGNNLSGFAFIGEDFSNFTF